MGRDQVDFFVSYAGADRAWAEWVAWQLTEAGYGVELDAWDWAAGENFVIKMADALDRANRIIVLWSRAYFDRSRYTAQDLSTAASIPGGREGRLVPLRIEEIPADQVPALMRPLVYRDLFDIPEDEARRVLLAAAAGRPGLAANLPFPDRASCGG